MSVAEIRTEQQTIQRLTIDSGDGRKFLNRVRRATLERRESWTVSAWASGDWAIKFRREIKGEPGEPDTEVTVLTDYIVPTYTPGERGEANKDLILLPATGCHFREVRDVAAVCKILATGDARIWITGSLGSLNSQRLGLSFYRVRAMLRDWPLEIQLGYETIAENGQLLTSGSVYIR